MPEKLHLNIEGMHCAACVRRVTNALSKVSGVTIEKVEVGSAQVQFDSASTSVSQIAAAVNDIGFNARAESPHAN